MRNVKKAVALTALALGLLMGRKASVYAAEIVQSGQCGVENAVESVTWTLDDEGVLIVSGEGEIDGAIFNDSISEYLFRVKKIIVEDGITVIGTRSFCKCIKATEVSIADSVTEIQRGAFEECMSIENIELPKKLTVIGAQAFKSCKWLQSIEIPDTVQEIGEDAFSNCELLTYAKLPSGLEKINDRLFLYCVSLKKVDIPDSVLEIGESAFALCGELENIQIPKGLRIIGNAAFEECSKLDNIKLPYSVSQIGERAFYKCSSLSAIHIPELVKIIEEEAFLECTGLETLTISEGVTEINTAAFKSCESLELIETPSTVCKIFDQAFARCTNLRQCRIYNHDYLVISPSAFIGTNCKIYGYAILEERMKTWSDNTRTFNSLCSIDIHAIEKNVNLAPTCTDMGVVADGKCSECDALFGEYKFSPALGHTLVHVLLKKPTYETEGNYEYYHCTRCDGYYKDAAADKPYKENAWKIPANKTKPGYMRIETTTESKITVKLIKQEITYKKVKKYKAKNLKRKKVTFSLKAKTSGDGNLSYKVIKGKKKYITVSKKGKVTLKKGCKKGTYKIQITAAKTRTFDGASKIVSIKVK